jgi:hypothetical protein
MLQFIILPLNYSSCPFSSTLSPIFTSPLSSPNLSPHYLFLLHMHDPLTSLLYQLYTSPAFWNPWQKHPSLQQKYTQTHTRATKPSSPHFSSSTHPSLFPLPLLMPLLPITQFSIYSLITVTAPSNTVYRYYHQGIFYMICKWLVWHCTWEFVIAKLHLQAKENIKWLTTNSVTTQKLNQGKQNRQLKPPTSLSKT